MQSNPITPFLAADLLSEARLPFRSTLRNISRRLAWGTAMCLALYFVWTNALRYLDVNPETYGYFWSKRTLLWLHLGGGVPTVVLGLLQFVGRIRNDYPQAHRRIGRVYLIALLCASIGAAGMVFTTPLGWTTAYAFVVMIGAWLATALMGWLSIRKRNLEAHRAWMRRNYIITFAFVTFRLAGKIPGLYALGTIEEVFTTFGWMSWVVPLLLSELFVSARQVLRARQTGHLASSAS